MKNIKIFLASSSELVDERTNFEIMISRQNKLWIEKDIYFELIIWEDFIDAMSKTRLQDEYNKSIKQCDIFVMLFFTKVGKYTREEFEMAFGQFKKNGRPFIYTYFKNAQVNIHELDESNILSLFEFKRRLNEMQHFYTIFKNTEDLKLQFLSQLQKLEDNDLLSHKIEIGLNLRQILNKVWATCKDINIYPYTVFILNELLSDPDSDLYKCLDNTRKGYAEALKSKLNDFSNKLINNEGTEVFNNQDWLEREDFQKAVSIAKQEPSNDLEERHLLLSILNSESNTIQYIKRDLDAEFTVLLNYVRGKQINKTPTINDA